TGDVAVWLLNGTTITGTGGVAQVPDFNWQIVAIGEVKGDGEEGLGWGDGSPRGVGGGGGRGTDQTRGGGGGKGTGRNWGRWRGGGVAAERDDHHWSEGGSASPRLALADCRGR